MMDWFDKYVTPRNTILVIVVYFFIVICVFCIFCIKDLYEFARDIVTEMSAVTTAKISIEDECKKDKTEHNRAKLNYAEDLKTKSE